MKSDLVTSPLVLAVGLGICLQSIQLGYGSLGRPGPGFLPFWCGTLFVLVALGILVHRVITRPWRTAERPASTGELAILRPIVILVAVVLYALLLPAAGFVLSNAVLLVALFRLVWWRSWRFIAVATVLVDAAFYLVFQVAIDVQLPKSALGIF